VEKPRSVLALGKPQNEMPQASTIKRLNTHRQVAARLENLLMALRYLPVQISWEINEQTTNIFHFIPPPKKN